MKFIWRAGLDKTIRIWNIDTRRQVKLLTNHTADVNVLTTLSNGFLVSGSDDSTVKIWYHA